MKKSVANGTTAVVRSAALDSLADTGAPSAASGTKSPVESVNILLVGGDRGNIETLESILTRPDYHLVRARTANEALLALVDQEIAVVVLDVQVPVIDGFELAELIKNCKRVQHIPIIFLTAYSQDDSDMADGYGAGVVDYLSKPVNPLALRSKVAIFVELYRKTHELARLNQAMETEIEHRLERVRGTLREKETLLKEIHHRMKNNLQVISSLLSLQADNLADANARRLLLDARDRVRSMALVHEKFSESHNLTRIELGEYLRSLMKDLLRAHASLASMVRFRIEQQRVFLPVDVAIPCGLIINELATNALKHAFRGRDHGEITIALRRLGDQHICVVIGDDGCGLPQGLDWSNSNTLGLRLVRMLTEQLNGTLELQDAPGTAYRLTVSVPVAVPTAQFDDVAVR